MIYHSENDDENEKQIINSLSCRYTVNIRSVPA